MSQVRFHETESGDAAICRASVVPCPLSSFHADSAAEVYAHIEQTANGGVVPRPVEHHKHDTDASSATHDAPSMTPAQAMKLAASTHDSTPHGESLSEAGDLSEVGDTADNTSTEVSPELLTSNSSVAANIQSSLTDDADTDGGSGEKLVASMIHSDDINFNDVHLLGKLSSSISEKEFFNMSRSLSSAISEQEAVVNSMAGSEAGSESHRAASLKLSRLRMARDAVSEGRQDKAALNKLRRSIESGSLGANAIEAEEQVSKMSDGDLRRLMVFALSVRNADAQNCQQLREAKEYESLREAQEKLSLSSKALSLITVERKWRNAQRAAGRLNTMNTSFLRGPDFLINSSLSPQGMYLRTEEGVDPVERVSGKAVFTRTGQRVLLDDMRTKFMSLE